MQILQTEDHKGNKKHKDKKKDVIVGQKKKSNGKSIEDDTIINVDDDDESQMTNLVTMVKIPKTIRKEKGKNYHHHRR